MGLGFFKTSKISEDIRRFNKFNNSVVGWGDKSPPVQRKFRRLKNSEKKKTNLRWKIFFFRTFWKKSKRRCIFVVPLRRATQLTCKSTKSKSVSTPKCAKAKEFLSQVPQLSLGFCCSQPRPTLLPVIGVNIFQRSPKHALHHAKRHMNCLYTGIKPQSLGVDPPC